RPARKSSPRNASRGSQMRIVITGGPSVGKTTIVSLLAQRGFKIVHEFATEIIREGVYLPWVDRSSFQNEVLRRQLKAEQALQGYDDLVFLDRGLFDGEAYYIYDKIEIPPVFAALDASQYSLAFLVEELPFFVKDEVRRENLEFTRQISIILEHCYASRNVEVVRVPAMSPEQRVDFVLEEIEMRRGLIARKSKLHEHRRRAGQRLMPTTVPLHPAAVPAV
ncbi:MAG TPA: ATP-binding protein, partial [Candidatus Obscuribacterales bacterium]